MKKLRLLGSLILLLNFSLIHGAAAVEIPLLTWERGREQQVVLGGGAYTADWKVTLEGNGIEPLTFRESAPNPAGYVVYSLYIPEDLPTGAYSVSTIGTGSPRTVVAGIALVEAQTKTPAASLFDLTQLIALFAFITALLTTLRSRRYSEIQYSNSQLLTAGQFDEGSFVQRLVQSPQRVRLRTITNLRPSLFKFLILQDGELLYRLSKPLYGALPFVGAIAGLIAAVEVDRNGTLANTGITIFAVIALIAIIDSYSGIFATVGFWSGLIFTGNLSSIRDVLIVLGVTLLWVGPGLISAIINQAVQRDLGELKSSDSLKRILGNILAPISGLAIFLFGNLLVESILYLESPTRAINWQLAVGAYLVITARIFSADQLLAKSTANESMLETFRLARVSSPQTALLIFFSAFGYIYIWTSNFATASLVALLFTVPYFLLFISFNLNRYSKLALLRRNVMLEAALVAVATFVIYRQIALQPLLVDQATSIMLLISALPGIFHAGFSAICSEAEKQEIIRL